MAYKRANVSAKVATDDLHALLLVGLNIKVIDKRSKNTRSCLLLTSPNSLIQVDFNAGFIYHAANN